MAKTRNENLAKRNKMVGFQATALEEKKINEAVTLTNKTKSQFLREATLIAADKLLADK